ncbi:MAG: YfhO family protein, partial [Promethearchaeota archaeon]
AGLGLFLSLGLYNPLYWVLYKIVPGFALFRVPARWLFLYAFGAAMLAGIGLQKIEDYLERRPSPSLPNWTSLTIGSLLVAIALLELFIAAEALPLNQATAPEAFSSLRTATTHIRAAQSEETAPGRFLSMSDILFDPGDLGEIQHMFRNQLPEQAIYDYLVAVKRKEVIAPNLPLAWHLYAVDGYDGGVLPLARYIHLQRLFLDEDEILPDGRLREGLKRIPPARLLSLLGAHYVITDKVHDVWIDDVFYDLAFDAVLGEDAASSIASDGLPQFTATSMGVVSHLEDGRAARDGTPVAEIHLTTGRGETMTFLLRAGTDTAEGLYGGDVAHAQARVGQSRRGFHASPEGSDYVTRLHWDVPSQISRVEVVALPFGGRVHIRGLTLIDERDGSNVPLILSTDGRFRQVHSGDVKIYQVLDALPRAYVVHQTRVIAGDEAALAAIAKPSFDPGRTAILAAGRELDESPPAEPQVTVLTYTPQEIALQATLHVPGYLVLSDAWYPGWRATAEGRSVVIERANVHFRAVYLAEGTHTVRLVYRPKSYFIGLGLSVLTALGIVFAAIKSRQVKGTLDA